MAADAPLDQALPWLLLAGVIAVLIAVVVGLLLSRRELSRELSRAEADLQAAEADLNRLDAANTALDRDLRRLSQDLARTRGERDTMRELLGSRARHPSSTPQPTAGDGLTEVVERYQWPQWPGVPPT